VRRRARFFQAALLTTLLVFGGLTFFARQAAYFPIDLTISLAVQSLPGGLFAALMGLVSWFGYAPQAYVLTGLVIVGLFAGGLRWESLGAALAAGVTGALNTAVKLWIARPRSGADLVQITRLMDTYSFPSGHVMFYTGFFGFLFFLAYTRLRPSWRRNLALILLGSLVGLVGLSRIYRGEHWSSDVLGAYLLGGLGLYAVIWAYRKLRRQFTWPAVRNPQSSD